jgi:UDP-glucose 4-epimerase
MDDSSTAGEIYNVGSGESVRIIDLAERIKAMTHSDSELKHVPYAEVYGLGIEDMLHRVPSTDKIKAAIGWQPTLDLDLILADVIKASRTTPLKESSRPRQLVTQPAGGAAMEGRVQSGD